jgi:hypothetical protein
MFGYEADSDWWFTKSGAFECLVSVHVECKVQSLLELSSAQNGDPEVSGNTSGKLRLQ